MERNEENIIDALGTIVDKAKFINENDQTLGGILLAFVKFSMDLYESIAKNEMYTVNEIVGFLSNVQGTTTNALLETSYPKDRDDALASANEDLTQFIMNADLQYKADVDTYEKEVAALVKDFKKTVAEIRP